MCPLSFIILIPKNPMELRSGGPQRYSLAVTPKEMALACSLVLGTGHDAITFIVPGAPTKRGVVRLNGPRSPKGELLCINSEKEMVVRFDAVDVLAYLAATGLVGVRVRPS